MNIFFSGLGGVGVGPLAEIARDAGHSVAGSDREETLMTKKLVAEGVQVHVGPQDGTFLQSVHATQAIDWFVYSPAVQDTNPELMCARELGIKTSKYSELLGHIIDEKGLKLLAVSGTHGKTTTTGMLVWALQRLGVPVSYSVGSTLSFGPSGHFEPSSEYFVYECDEFDRKFLYFAPFLSIIPSLDYDHSDTYPDRQDYLEAFHQFAENSQQVIAWSDQHGEIFSELSNVSLLDPSERNDDLRVAGIHNRRNATLVQRTLKELGFETNTNEILSSFPGTDRRFEKLADNLYSDYGHHPIEIAATLQLAREVSDNVVLVYQPHQNVRQHELRGEYTDQFELAEKIYWLPTYLSREDPSLPILTPEDLIETITNKDKVSIVDLDEELWKVIQEALGEGKLVLCMGAGAIDGWVREMLTRTPSAH